MSKAVAGFTRTTIAQSRIYLFVFFFFFYMTTGLSLSLRFLSSCIQHFPKPHFVLKSFLEKIARGWTVDIINELWNVTKIWKTNTLLFTSTSEKKGKHEDSPMMPPKESLPALSSLYNEPLYSPKETLTSDCKNGCLGKPPIFSLRTRDTWQQPVLLLLTSRCFHGNCHCRDGYLRQVLNNARKVKNFEKVSFCVFQDDYLFR